MLVYYIAQTLAGKNIGGFIPWSTKLVTTPKHKKQFHGLKYFADKTLAY